MTAEEQQWAIYIAPEVLSRNFGNVSYNKSDVYSFGMLLLEMVGGRKNIDLTVDNTSQVYFPEWVYNHMGEGEELRMRNEDERQSEIARKLTIVGLWCIQRYPADRPSMKVVIQMLEGEAGSLTRSPTKSFNLLPQIIRRCRCFIVKIFVHINLVGQASDMKYLSRLKLYE